MLSEELCSLSDDIFPGSTQVRRLGKGGAADVTVRQLAREHGALLVTKDEDFHRLSVIRGAPPKVVWVRLGNCTTADVARLLRHHRDDIAQFASQTEATFLELG